MVYDEARPVLGKGIIQIIGSSRPSDFKKGYIDYNQVHSIKAKSYGLAW